VGAFLDEVISPFYEKCSTSQDQFAFGQIFRAAAYYPQQSLEVWRPKTFNPQLGFAGDFEIEPHPKNAFKKAVPYSRPSLRTNEEFLAIKAKPRPVILIRPPDASLLELQKQARSRRITHHLCSVALIYRVVDETGTPRFPAQFLERVRRLEYRQFLFLPKGGSITADSLARIDEVQSTALNQLDPTAYRLSADLVAIMRSQVSFYLTELAGQDFAGWAELLRQS
jgi:hypothetical protein